MTVVLGSDHAGFDLKEIIKAHLKAKGHAVIDVGPDASSPSVSYVTYARRAAHMVSSGAAERGVLVCGSGIGVSIVANKTRGVRCALCSCPFTAALARQHNDANMVALGARLVAAPLALAIIDVFITTLFEGGRHAERVATIEPDEGGSR